MFDKNMFEWDNGRLKHVTLHLIGQLRMQLLTFNNEIDGRSAHCVLAAVRYGKDKAASPIQQ